MANLSSILLTLWPLRLNIKYKMPLLFPTSHCRVEHSKIKLQYDKHNRVAWLCEKLDISSALSFDIKSSTYDNCLNFDLEDCSSLSHSFPNYNTSFALTTPYQLYMSKILTFKLLSNLSAYSVLYQTNLSPIMDTTHNKNYYLLVINCSNNAITAFGIFYYNAS